MELKFYNKEEKFMKTIFISILLLICFVTNYAQSSLEPAWKPVYEFLNRMSLKGIITSDEFVKPLLRKDIGKYLSLIISSKTSLTEVEKEELDWYLSEYAAEVYNKNNMQPDLYGGFINNVN